MIAIIGILSCLKRKSSKQEGKNEKYILIEVRDRDITTHYFDTKIEAQQAMKNFLIEVSDDDLSEELNEFDEQLKNGEDIDICGDDFRITKNSAWCNHACGNHSDWDAKIEKIEE